MYNIHEVEDKWQRKWAEDKIFRTNLNDHSRPKYYNLVMFPYPSGDKLHIGHWYNYGPADSWGRYMRMNGYNVLEPIGFDSFGLPAENYAIKTGIPPAQSISTNCEYMRRQLKAIGTMHDWDKEVVTSDPEYYTWTQWVFLQLYEQGLAYKKKAQVNWCPSCQTVLANEQAQDGVCERCKSEVEQKDLVQWFFKIRDYAEPLLNHSHLDWPEKTKLMQKNWIGRSEGIVYSQKVKDMSLSLEAYDSVPQTFMAQTFAVIAPEHPLLPELIYGTEQEKEVVQFIDEFKKRKLKKKFDIANEVDGIFTGRYIDNPFGTGDLPIWVATFVVAEYGSGFVNCSAHDERDFAFAKRYKIPLRPVMFPADPIEADKIRNLEYCYHHDEHGVIQLPTQFHGRLWGEARQDIIDYIEQQQYGKRTVNYKLRDWLISRQRYWGAPIPIVYDPDGNPHPVAQKYLPWMLPTDVDYNPKGKSPLASSKELFKRTEKIFGKGWTPEVDTMDTFVCSSWYFLRYLSPHDETQAFDMKIVEKWFPVDMYIGGPEHACMHLLYARFIHKVLVGDPGSEPFKRLVHQGLVTKDGVKMSKSKGNVVSPDDFVADYGSDVFRMYLMFMGPFEGGGDWSDKGINGISRFVERFWRVVTGKSAATDPDRMTRLVHKTVKRVTHDIEILHFNTAIAAMMELVNELIKDGIDRDQQLMLIKLIAPLAPHLAEEAWVTLGEKGSVFDQLYPKFDPALVEESSFHLVIQINGKVRGILVVDQGITEQEAIELAKNHENASKYLGYGAVQKVLYIPGKLVNFVVR